MRRMLAIAALALPLLTAACSGSSNSQATATPPGLTAASPTAPLPATPSQTLPATATAATPAEFPDAIAAMEAWLAGKLDQPDFKFVGSCQQAAAMQPPPYGRWCWQQATTDSGDDATYSAGAFATGGGFKFHLKHAAGWTITGVEACDEMGCQVVS